MGNIVELVGSHSVNYGGRGLPLYEMNGKFYFLGTIAMEHLERDEDAQPRQYDSNQSKRIAESIRRKVLMQPLLARYDQKRNKVLIIEGQHRWRAMKDELHQKGVPCIVYVDLDRNVALLCGLEANAEDRARSLSGGDMARKTHALMREYRELVAKETDVPENEVTEMQVLKRMIAKVTRSAQKRFILGTVLEDLRSSRSKIVPYITDRQRQDTPITARNFMFFLQHLVRTRAVEDTAWEAMREQEFANVIKVTDMFAEMLFEGRWTPTDPESRLHIHAQNVCRRHPLETCAYVIASILMESGAPSLYQCFFESNEINCDNVSKLLSEKLADPIWNEDHIRFERSIEELRVQLDRHWRSRKK